MQPFSFFFILLAIRWGGGGGGISGRVRALNLTLPLGSGRVGSDNLGYGPGSGFSFEPVQTSSLSRCIGWSSRKNKLFKTLFEKKKTFMGQSISDLVAVLK